MLREHPWNFAIKRVELARLTTDPIFEFDAQFELPADCLRVTKTDDDLLPFRVEGSALLINTDSVKIEYISQITDTTQFDSLFTEALIKRIASKLSFNLSDNNALTQFIDAQYQRIVKQARSMDGQEGTPRAVEADQWLNSRL